MTSLPIIKKRDDLLPGGSVGGSVVGGKVVGGTVDGGSVDGGATVEHSLNAMSSIAISPLKSPPRSPSKYT